MAKLLLQVIQQLPSVVVQDSADKGADTDRRDIEVLGTIFGDNLPQCPSFSSFGDWKGRRKLSSQKEKQRMRIGTMQRRKGTQDAKGCHPGPWNSLSLPFKM